MWEVIFFNLQSQKVQRKARREKQIASGRREISNQKLAGEKGEKEKALNSSNFITGGKKWVTCDSDLETFLKIQN